jgi:hypothetical protein
MTKLADSMSSWIKNGGAAEVSEWLKDGTGYAQELGAVFTDDVVPIFGALGNAWASVPDDLKKLLIGGVVAQKASSWLFGGGGLYGALGDLLKSGGKLTVQTLTDTVGIQKVLVMNEGFGLNPTSNPGGGGPNVTPVGGTNWLLKAGEIALLSAVAIEVWDNVASPIGKDIHDAIFGKDSNDIWSQVANWVNTPIDQLIQRAGILANIGPGAPSLYSSDPTSLQNSHDKPEESRGRVAGTAIDAIINWPQHLPPVKIDLPADLLTHRDNSAIEMHAAAQSLDSAVRSWRGGSASLDSAARELHDSRPPVPHVTTNVTVNVSGKDVSQTQSHSHWYTPGGGEVST